MGEAGASLVEGGEFAAEGGGDAGSAVVEMRTGDVCSVRAASSSVSKSHAAPRSVFVTTGITSASVGSLARSSATSSGVVESEGRSHRITSARGVGEDLGRLVGVIACDLSLLIAIVVFGRDRELETGCVEQFELDAYYQPRGRRGRRGYWRRGR